MKDSLGMVCSGLCLGHCVLTPVLLMLGGLGFFSLLASEWVHWLLLIPIVLLAGLSLPQGYRRHRQRWPLGLGASGLLLLLLALVADHKWEPVLSVGGGLLLISGHWGNRQWLTRLRELPGANA